MTSLGAILRLVVGRMRHDRAVLAGAALIVLLATTLVAAGLVYADAVAAAGLHRTLAVAAPSSSGVEIGGPLRSDRLDALDAEIRDAAAEVFGSGAARVAQRLSSASFALPDQPGEQVTELALVRAFEGIEDHASLVEGAWPEADGAPAEGIVTAPIDAALASAAAAALGLEIGDTVALTSRLDPQSTVDLRVVGTWRPDDPTDRYWWGDELDLHGVAESATYRTHGPFVVARATFLAVPAVNDGAAVDWRIEPRIGDIAVTEVSGLIERLGMLGSLLPSAEQLAVRGDLAEVLRDAERSLTVTRASVTVVTLQLAILAGYALVLTGGLIIERRRAETALAGARGATRGQLLAAAAIEAALIAVPCAIAAPAAATLALTGFNAVGPLADTGLAIAPRVGPLALAAVAVAALGCVVGLALPALSRRSVVVERTARGRAARRAQLQRAGLDVALLVVAGVALWQLQRFGSPLSAAVRERVGIDPLLVAAPALGLLAGAIIALRILPLTARTADLVADAGRGVVGPLGAWQLARRPLRYAPVTLLLIVTVALGVFGLGYGRSWMGSQRDQADFSVGADIRVAPARDRATVGLGAAYRALPGVTEAAAVARSRIDLAGVTTSELLLVDPEAARSVILLRGDLGSDLGQLLDGLVARRAAAPLVALPGSPRAIALDVRLRAEGEAVPGSADPFALPEMRVAVVVRDGHGVLHRVTSDAIQPDGLEREAVIPLGDATGPIAPPVALAGIELVTRVANNGAMSGTFAVASLAAGDSADGGAWTPVALEPGWTAAARSAGRPSGSAEIGADASVAFTSAGPRLRETPPLTISMLPPGLDSVAVTPAVIVSDAFARRATRGSGSEIPLDFGAGVVPSPILGQLRAVPSTDPTRPAAIADLASVSLARYADDGTVVAPNEWWLTVSGDPAAAVAALRGPSFESGSVIGRAERAAQQQTDPVALGVLGALVMGVLASGAFAVIGFVASTAMAARERLSEFAVLRALGLSGGQLAAWLAIENVTLTALSLVIGTLLGFVITGVVVPFVALTPSGEPPFPELRIAVPWGQVIVFEVLIVVALAVALTAIVVLLRRIGLGAALRIGED